MAPNCPVDAATRCASNAASEQTTAFSVFLRRRSPRRVNQATWPARATAPEQGSSRRSCAFKRLQAQDVSATPSDEIAAALAFTMAKRLLEVVTAVGSAPVFASLQLRVSVRRPLAKLRVATAAVERSEALGSSRRSCNFHKRFCDST